MRTVIFPLLFVLFASFCTQNKKSSVPQNNNQEKNTMRFDSLLYKKTDYGFNSYLKEDGFEVIMIGFDKESGGVLKERFPKPSFYVLYKEFYPNGNLKRKNKIIGKNVYVGLSEYYDADGNLISSIDEDKKFGKIKPDDILLFLEKKGVINIAEGTGGLDYFGNPSFSLYFKNENNKKVWKVIIENAKPNNGSFDGIGEPLTYAPEAYIIDGETGEEIKLE